MCCINHHLKAIFIHITKNGGSTIENILCNYYDFIRIRYTRSDHREFNNIIENFIENKENYPIDFPYGLFSIRLKGVLRYLEGTLTKDVTAQLKISNPHKKTHANNPRHAKYFDLSDYYVFTFVRNPYDRLISSWRHCLKHNKKDEFKISDDLQEFITNRDELKDSHYCHSFITQYQNLINSENKFKIDFVGRFECLNEDLIKVLIHFKLPIRHLEYLEKNIKCNKSERSDFVDYFNVRIIHFVNDFFKEDFIHFNYKICKSLEELKEMNKLYYISEQKLQENNNKLIEYIKTENIELEDITTIHPTIYNNKKKDKYKNYR